MDGDVLGVGDGGGDVVAFTCSISYTAKPTTAAPISVKATFLSMR
ncbi:MAG: hypothetical protein QXZ22_09160 [Sulfolobales archaeon]